MQAAEYAMSRKPQKAGYCRRDSAEHEEEGRALSATRTAAYEDAAAQTERESKLLEQILDVKNLNDAYKRVKRNKGAGGVDGMKVGELKSYLLENGHALKQSLLAGTYIPQPVRRVEIPKDNGKKRQLGIPTAVDRVIQQAIAQKLSPIYERQFSDSSYGFRPGRSAHHALLKCRGAANEGYRYAVDMDLEKFFDTVNQSKLMEILSRTIKDGRVLSLISKYLKAGVIIAGRQEPTTQGVPQGGPLSPLCANILLNELDKELEKRGHTFARYADDCIILCKSKRGAQRTLEHIIPYIEKKLYLKVNREKTVTAYIGRVKYLGYSFYVNSKREARLCIHPKSIVKLKERLRAITAGNNGKSYEARKAELKSFVTGWVNYYKLADMKELLKGMDQWLRRRLRMCIWKRWKRVRTRYAMLRKLGIQPEWKIHECANMRKGPWRCAINPIVAQAISEERLKRAGYTSLTDCYLAVRGG